MYREYFVFIMRLASWLYALGCLWHADLHSIVVLIFSSARTGRQDANVSTSVEGRFFFTSFESLFVEKSYLDFSSVVSFSV